MTCTILMAQRRLQGLSGNATLPDSAEEKSADLFLVTDR